MHDESMEVNEKEEFLFFPMQTNTLQKRQQFLGRPPSKEKCKELEKQYLNSKETIRRIDEKYQWCIMESFCKSQFSNLLISNHLEILIPLASYLHTSKSFKVR